jgi:tRNA pseudouridine38-40 synthase
MVRNLIGTLVAVGRGRLTPEAVGRLVASGERRLAPATAPASGLCLVRVAYDDAPAREAAREKS